MQTKQSKSKHTNTRKGGVLGKTVVAILAAVLAVGAIEAGAKSLAQWTTSAAEQANVARPDLWAITQSKLHN
jgi:hypothetical protein